jgi:hypothetical protein
MQRDDESAELRLPNGVPLANDWATHAAMAIGLIVLLALVYFTRGGPILGGAFLALGVGAYAAGMIGNRRRRPTYVTLSADGIRAEFRNGRTRSIRWEEVGQVRLQRFLGETYAALRYGSGRWERGVHIYGDAALKVKEWFDNSRSSH